MTIEDIVEQIVGDILDEHDRDRRSPEIVPDAEDPSRIHLAGRAGVREINQRFGLRIEEEARAELRLLARMGERSGLLAADQRRMIHSVLNLYQRNVAHVMRPLVDIVAIGEETSCERFLQIAAEAGHSRIPVYEGRIYNFIGIVNLLDVVYSGRGQETIGPLVRRDVLFVPESKPIRELLTEIRSSPHSMAFVVDEYGGVVGLVTVEDLVEEIVGDLSDERDPADHIRRIGPRTVECDGRTEVSRLVEELDLPIPAGGYETISGYVLHRLRAIPKPGDRIELDENFTITVSQADSRGIQRLRTQSKGRDFALLAPAPGPGRVLTNG